MRFRKALSAAVLAGGLSFAGGASAQFIAVDNICELTTGGVLTVNARLISPGLFDYTFTRLGDGQIYNFPATTAGWNRKFALPAGTYKMTFKHPNSTPVGTYPQNVLVKPFRTVNRACVFTMPLDGVSRARPQAR